MFGTGKTSALATCLIVLVFASAFLAQAQDPASCNFQVFQLPHSQQSSNQAFAINRSRTVVGEVAPNDKPVQGFIRTFAGYVKYLLAPDSSWSIFTGINDDGVRIGNYIANGSFLSIDFAVEN